MVALEHYFIDPVLRAPTIGCMLMCLASSLVGTLVFVKRRSLLSESLSHATYPGVIMGASFAAFFSSASSPWISIGILGGAFLTAILGLWTIEWLEKRLRIHADAALCFVLSTFFGLGILLASRMQMTNPVVYKQLQVFLFGQPATMTDKSILVYGILAVSIVIVMLIFFRRLKVIHFDRKFASSLGFRPAAYDLMIHFLLALAIVIGIRSVGVVLMSAMLISPSIAVRQFSKKLSHLFILASFFGVLSGFFGCVLSNEIPAWIVNHFGGKPFFLPTGPTIVLCLFALCLISLLFSPKNGVLIRLWRSQLFSYQCHQENLLKEFWKDPGSTLSIHDLALRLGIKEIKLRLILFHLLLKRQVHLRGVKLFTLTQQGENRATQIVRLHRLWELYLVRLGQKAQKVHVNAEEMEHILSPDLERELTELLGDPLWDPHDQPIPKKG